MEFDLYHLNSIDDILGNEYSISKMRNFCSDVNKGLKRAPLMLFGPSGVGKTSSAHLLAQENNWNVVELNASDYRDKESLDRRLLSAATSKSLFGKRNLILLDEIDELAGRFDAGSGAARSALMDQAKNPIIFIANDMWDQKISFLRGKCEPVEFRRVSSDAVQRVLQTICKRNSIRASREIMDIISNRCNGDVRSAINDLSVIIDAENEDATEVIGLRDRKIDVFAVLDKIFTANTLSAPLRAMANSDVPNDMLIKWIDENIPKKYSQSAELRNAFESLSCASIYSARAVRSQYYTYWRYMNVMMSGGVALSKRRNPNPAGYSFPKVIKDLSASKSARNQEKAMAAKLQNRFHSSIAKIIKNEMPMLSRIVSKSIMENKEHEDEIRSALARMYLLDEKEIDYMIERNVNSFK